VGTLDGTLTVGAIALDLALQAGVEVKVEIELEAVPVATLDPLLLAKLSGEAPPVKNSGIQSQRENKPETLKKNYLGIFEKPKN
jgi:hypothetical protein